MTTLKAAVLCAALVVGYTSQARAGDGQHEQMVKMLERQAGDVSKNAPDCKKIGQALLKKADADAALMKKVIAADKAKTPAQRKAEKSAFMKKYGARLKAARTKMEPLRSCTADPTVREWKKKLDAAARP